MSASSSPAVTPTTGAAGAAVIGRLPTHPLTSAASEDDEIELLELQLLATQPPNSPPSKISVSSWSSFFGGESSTFPRRRRFQRSLMTLWHDRGLLEEAQPVQTKRMLARITIWDFNAFAFDRLTSGRNLATLCTHLFQVRA
jgi:hypothetical protein